MKRLRFYGSVTVEASVALSVFIFGYLTVLSLVFAVRTEGAVQYGITQTAAEISRCCYIAEKLSLTEYAGKAGMTVGEAIEAVSGLSDIRESSEAEAGESGNLVSQLADAVSGGASIGGMLGEPLFRAVFAECVAGSRAEADEYLMNLAGITTDDIDFHYSSVLSDGKTVEIVAVYDVKLRTFGLFGKNGITMKMKNTAVTSAWVTGNGQEDDGESTKWSLPSFERGKAWIAEIKSEHSMDAVKGGKGIDLYRTGKYTMINSLNVFAQTYSECSSPGSKRAADYSIKEAALEKVISGYATELLECIEAKAGSLQFENGIHVPDSRENFTAELIIVVPSEAGAEASVKKVLEKTAEKILKDTGVTVVYEYREKALV